MGTPKKASETLSTAILATPTVSSCQFLLIATPLAEEATDSRTAIQISTAAHAYGSRGRAERAISPTPPVQIPFAQLPFAL